MTKTASDNASVERILARHCYDRGVYHLLPGTSEIDGEYVTAEFKRTICGADQTLEEKVTKLFVLESRPVENRNFVNSPAIRNSQRALINDDIRGCIIKPVATIHRNITDDNGVICDRFNVTSYHDLTMSRLSKWCNSVSAYATIAHSGNQVRVNLNLHLLVKRSPAPAIWEHYLPCWKTVMSGPYDGSIDHMVAIAEVGRTAAFEAIEIMSNIRKLRRKLAMARTPDSQDAIQSELDELLSEIN